jgi:CDP-glycerol glycerophosphotransferase (TagB/SpsB family)
MDGNDRPTAARAVATRAARRIYVLARILLVRIGFSVGRVTGPPDRVVLATAHSNELRGNLAVIAAELDRRGIAAERLAYQPGRSAGARIGGLRFHVRAGYALARARLFVVDDYFFPLYAVKPRPTSVAVQVWHASGALKKFGYSVLDKSFGADATVLDLVRIHSHYDLCLVSSGAAIPAYAEAFRQPPRVFVPELGIPRTDVLLGQDRDRRAQNVRRRYGIGAGTRVVLLAPTFRGDRVLDARAAGLPDLARLARALGDDTVLLLRLHPFVRHRAALPDGGGIVDVSDAPELNEVMLAADVLVTDYSSAVFDFALLGRPIVLFAPDIGAYDAERGFYVEYPAEVPAPVATTTDELIERLRDPAFDAERVAAFARRWFDAADGHATDRFVDLIVQPALAGSSVTAEGVRAAIRDRAG